MEQRLRTAISDLVIDFQIGRGEIRWEGGISKIKKRGDLIIRGSAIGADQASTQTSGDFSSIWPNEENSPRKGAGLGRWASAVMGFICREINDFSLVRVILWQAAVVVTIHVTANLRPCVRGAVRPSTPLRRARAALDLLLAEFPPT
jgi:hypothetical protein